MKHGYPLRQSALRVRQPCVSESRSSIEGVAQWTTAITTALPEEFTSSLPSIAELEAEMSEPPTNREDTTGQRFEHDDADGSGGVQRRK